jgi:hypothetical protein
LKVDQEDCVAFLARQSNLALILAIDVFEHLPSGRREDFMQAASASLAAGGCLVLQFPNPTSPLFGSTHYSDPTHDNPITPRLVRVMLENSGFQGVELLETGPVPEGIAGRLRWITWKIISGALLLVDMAETGSRELLPRTRVCIVVAWRLREGSDRVRGTTEDSQT